MAGKSNPNRLENETMKDLIMRIEGMKCDACASRVETVLEDASGVNRVAVSLEASQARVAVDDAVDPSHLVDSIRAEGFDASLGT